MASLYILCICTLYILYIYIYCISYLFYVGHTINQWSYFVYLLESTLKQIFMWNCGLVLPSWLYKRPSEGVKTLTKIRSGRESRAPAACARCFLLYVCQDEKLVRLGGPQHIQNIQIYIKYIKYTK